MLLLQVPLVNTSVLEENVLKHNINAQQRHHVQLTQSSAQISHVLNHNNNVLRISVMKENTIVTTENVLIIF
jgi:hypothetical protein